MILAPAEHRRELKTIRLDCDLAITGGGLAGVCCAITAARAGIKVVLIHDRPVPGGNASSEVRLWILGATSHMGNNNRWAREGGVIDEILVENMYRNPEGNPLLVDALLLEMLVNEPNITLLLNTAVFELTKRDADTIESLRAFCSQNSTQYEVRAPLFCDASGDGVVGVLAGAARGVWGEVRSIPGIWRTAGSLTLLLFQGCGQTGQIHAAELRADRHHQNSPVPLLQYPRHRLPALVARVRRTPRHGPRH
jgi:NADPH-dependent 2,4-dienoyl-CoA reductase/sulfur reductase-like enzyme